MMAIDPQPTGAFQWTQEPWGRALRCPALPARHLFTSRDLVLRDDEREWDAVAASLDVTRERLLLIAQVHGVDVAIARRGRRGDWTRPQADIIVTDDPDVAIGVRVADCAPLLLIDTALGAAAAAHAGWRGTARNAARAPRAARVGAFGSRPQDLTVAIGPCLGACCGEVGPDVVAAFRTGGASSEELERWFAPGGGDRSFLDLEGANRDQLVAAGVDPARIFSSGLCTKTNREHLHSYRAARETAGRLLAAIRPA
jgi:YfiH family protein